MNALATVNELTNDETRVWLERALHGQERLPRLTPDESPSLGILRLDKSLKPAARDSLRDGCRQLVRQFCVDGNGQVAYLEELLYLASAFKDPETVEELAKVAIRFPQLSEIAPEVKVAVLATLVDTPPPRAPDFWVEILKQNPEKYAPLALSGVLAVNPFYAITMLPAPPDNDRIGQAAALKLDLAWDNLLPAQRFQFIHDVRDMLPLCGNRFAVAVNAWAKPKDSARSASLPPLWVA